MFTFHRFALVARPAALILIVGNCRRAFIALGGETFRGCSALDLGGFDRTIRLGASVASRAIRRKNGPESSSRIEFRDREAIIAAFSGEAELSARLDPYPRVSVSRVQCSAGRLSGIPVNIDDDGMRSRGAARKPPSERKRETERGRGGKKPPSCLPFTRDGASARSIEETAALFSFVPSPVDPASVSRTFHSVRLVLACRTRRRVSFAGPSGSGRAGATRVVGKRCLFDGRFSCRRLSLRLSFSPTFSA